MSGRKRAHDENLLVTPPNKSFTFVDGFAPKKTPPVYFAKNTKHSTRSRSPAANASDGEELVAKKKEELDVEQLRAVWQSEVQVSNLCMQIYK